MKNKKEIIAQWYAEQILKYWQSPYDDIEWLVMNLKKDAMQTMVDAYEELNNKCL